MITQPIVHSHAHYGYGLMDSTNLMLVEVGGFLHWQLAITGAWLTLLVCVLFSSYKQYIAGVVCTIYSYKQYFAGVAMLVLCS